MINAKEFIKALDELESTKGISKESIIEALKEAMEKGFIKQLGTTDDMEEARVRVDINPKKAIIAMYNIKTVVEEVVDDFVQISVEDANKEAKDGHVYQVGDDFEIEVPTDELTKLTAQNIKSVLKQKLSESEKAAIFEAYADKKGEMINGIVEKVDERSTIVNIGRTSVYLPNNQKIAGETFKPGEAIKLYIVDVISTTKGPQISVSRSDAGFLKRLFEEEIHEIFEGSVVIKDIAREAGERSKVAVYSTDPNIDAIGSCIGPNGTRIQKICGALGNAKEKEKIDIIAYNENPALYIVEALKPSTVVGIAMDEENHKATAVVKNEELSLAIGKRGVNARLAVKLTGWNIDIKELDDAMKSGVIYKSIDDVKREIEAAKVSHAIVEEENPVAEETVENTPVEETPAETIDEVVEPVQATEEVSQPVVETPAVEPLPVKEQPKVQPAPTPVPVVETKVKLADLEKELEEEKKRRDRMANGTYKKRVYKKNDEDEEFVDNKDEKPTVDKSTYMSIYTEEELEAMKKEEMDNKENDVDDEVDYDEFDSYYDDDNK